MCRVPEYATGEEEEAGGLAVNREGQAIQSDDQAVWAGNHAALEFGQCPHGADKWLWSPHRQAGKL